MSNLNKLLVLIALVCSVLLFWGGPGAYSSRSFQQAWNLGHLLLFAILTYLTLKWSETISNWPFFKQVTVLLAGVFLISLPIEFTQMGFTMKSTIRAAGITRTGLTELCWRTRDGTT